MRKSQHLLTLLSLVLTASTLVPLGGCKTTEANYKSAYESAAARRAERTSADGDDTAAAAPIAGANGVVREFLSPAPLADGATP
ncbi:MAG: hypothetical protein K2M97_05520, partial [Muribaculaceae bacterium]|nr:hypothetical protein [Muribaculaceae bacterium]